MATEKTYNGDGSDTTFDITFPYLTHADIGVSVGGQTKTVGSDYSITGNTVTFTTAPATGIANVKLYRNTNIDTPEHEYSAGSSITAARLNENQKQALYAIEEAKLVTTTSGGITTGDKNDITVNSDTDWVIRTNAVEKSMMADNSVGTDEIETNAVTAAELANNAVDTAAIADNAVTGDKIADNLDIPDNNYIRFGTGNDFKLRHSGDNAYLENSTGAIIIKSDITSFRNGADTETLAYFSANGSALLYYDNAIKLTTTLGGINVTGDFNMTGELNMTGEGNKFIDTAHVNNVLHFRRINGDDTGHTNSCVVGSNLVWSADFNDTSDEKLKENITSIADGTISKVKQLRPVTFDWKDSTRNNNVSGFIAQEVKTVLPNLVDGTEYDPTIIDEKTGCIKSTGYSLNTIGIVANLTKALQEAITRIETLETEVATLKAK